MKTFRHLRNGCTSICAVFFGPGRPTMESALWRCWTTDPLPHWRKPTNSDDPTTGMATCHDCGASFMPIRQYVVERRAGVDVENPLVIASQAARSRMAEQALRDQQEALRRFAFWTPAQRQKSLEESIARQQRAFTPERKS